MGRLCARTHPCRARTYTHIVIMNRLYVPGAMQFNSVCSKAYGRTPVQHSTAVYKGERDAGGTPHGKGTWTVGGRTVLTSDTWDNMNTSRCTVEIQNMFWIYDVPVKNLAPNGQQIELSGVFKRRNGEDVHMRVLFGTRSGESEWYILKHFPKPFTTLKEHIVVLFRKNMIFSVRKRLLSDILPIYVTPWRHVHVDLVSELQRDDQWNDYVSTHSTCPVPAYGRVPSIPHRTPHRR